jgi:hypothetical protein
VTAVSIYGHTKGAKKHEGRLAEDKEVHWTELGRVK